MGTDYPVIINSKTYLLYGTSASAPLFAAMISLLNSRRLEQNQSSIGWLNPMLYQAGSWRYFPNTSNSIYNDITIGDNLCCAGGDSSSVTCCESGFYTTTGWDPVTGSSGVVQYIYTTSMACVELHTHLICHLRFRIYNVFQFASFIY